MKSSYKRVPENAFVLDTGNVEVLNFFFQDLCCSAAQMSVPTAHALNNLFNKVMKLFHKKKIISSYKNNLIRESLSHKRKIIP